MSNLRRYYAEFNSQDRTLAIQGDELFHLKTVIRGKSCDPVEIINGKGNLAHGEIKEISRDQALVQVREMLSWEKPEVQIIVAPSLLKKKPMNDLIEKLTEMGVDEIWPVLFARTEASATRSARKKWEKIAIQALKVNRKLWKTSIAEPMEIEQILSLAEKTKTKILLDIGTEMNNDIPWIPPAIAVVGPPGDFTPEEKELFQNHDFTRFRLNDSILRTETAAISIGAILEMKASRGKRKND